MHAYFYPGLTLAPMAFRQLIQAIPASRWDEATDPGRFTLREAIAHLADREPIFRERIQAALDQEGAQIQGIDEGVRAEEQGYRTYDVMATLRKFEEERAKTVALLQTLTPAQWARMAVHNEKGPMSVDEQANMILGHDIYHLEHLTQYLSPTDKVASTW